MSLAFDDMTPAGQDISQRDYFVMLYKEELAKGKSVADAREYALQESRQFQEAKAEAQNDGLSPAEATVVAQKVASENKPYDTAVTETQTSSIVVNTIRSGAITIERFVLDNLIPVVLGVIGFIALIVFVLFTKPGQGIAKAIGAPVKRG